MKRWSSFASSLSIRASSPSKRFSFLGSDQEVSDPAGERSEGCIAKRKRRVTSSARRRFSKK